MFLHRKYPRGDYIIFLLYTFQFKTMNIKLMSKKIQCEHALYVKSLDSTIRSYYKMICKPFKRNKNKNNSKSGTSTESRDLP